MCHHSSLEVQKLFFVLTHPHEIPRFRLLKEQEAKRRREKEEERQKAEAGLSNQNSNKAQEQDGKSNTVVVAKGDNEKNGSSAVEETSDGTVAVNGKPSIHKDEITNGKVNVSHEAEQQHSHET